MIVHRSGILYDDSVLEVILREYSKNISYYSIIEEDIILDGEILSINYRTRSEFCKSSKTLIHIVEVYTGKTYLGSVKILVDKIDKIDKVNEVK